MSDATKYSKLANKRVLILGGSAGLGFAVAEASIESGANVIISSSNSSRLGGAVDKIKQAYPSAGSRITGEVLDLSTMDVESRIEALFQKIGKVDHIVFTAADKLSIVPLEEITIEKMYKAGHIRFFACMMVCKVGKNYLNPGPRSSIVITTGAVAQKPIAGWSMVTPFATGLIGMTQQLARDMAPIRINCVAPGAVETDLWSDMPRDQFEKFKENAAKSHLTGEFGQAEDVAESYLYLMKDANVTGSVVSTNSGSLMV